MIFVSLSGVICGHKYLRIVCLHRDVSNVTLIQLLIQHSFTIMIAMHNAMQFCVSKSLTNRQELWNISK